MNIISLKKFLSSDVGKKILKKFDIYDYSPREIFKNIHDDYLISKLLKDKKRKYKNNISVKGKNKFRSIYIDFYTFKKEYERKKQADYIVFNDVDISEIDFSGCKIENSIFYNIKLENNNFHNIKISNTVFCKVDIVNFTFNDIYGNNIHFIHSDMNLSVLNNINVHYLKIENCNLLNIKIDNSKLKSSEFNNNIFKNGEIDNSDISDSKLKNNKFKKFNITNSNLTNSNLKHNYFERSNIQHSDLSGADFFDSELYNLNLIDSVLNKTNFTNAKLLNIKVYLEEIYKAKLYPFQLTDGSLMIERKNKIRIFISYSHQDKKIVDQLAESLSERSINVWVDSKDILPGDSLIRKIKEAIDSSQYVCAILSNSSINSKWVQEELDIAINQQIAIGKVKVVPIIIESGLDLPSFLLGKAYIDLTNPTNLNECISLILRRIYADLDVHERKIFNYKREQSH